MRSRDESSQSARNMSVYYRGVSTLRTSLSTFTVTRAESPPAGWTSLYRGGSSFPRKTRSARASPSIHSRSYLVEFENSYNFISLGIPVGWHLDFELLAHDQQAVWGCRLCTHWTLRGKPLLLELFYLLGGLDEHGQLYARVSRFIKRTSSSSSRPNSKSRRSNSSAA